MASVNINDRGQLIFRHPRIIVNGYGKVICKGVAKIPDSEHLDIKKGLTRLLEIKPQLPSEVKDERIDGKPLHDVALELYFDPLKIKPPSLDGKDVPEITPAEREKNFIDRASGRSRNSRNVEVHY